MIAEVPVETEPAEPQEPPVSEEPPQEPPQEPPEPAEEESRGPPEREAPEHSSYEGEIEVEDVPEPKRRAKAAPKKAAKAKAAPKAKAPAAPKPKPRKPKATIEPSSPVAPRGRFDTFSSLELAAELLHRRQSSAREQKRLVYKSWLE